MGRVPLALIGVALVVSAGAGCAKVQARIAPAEPGVTLQTPPPPPRVVETYAPVAAAPLVASPSTARETAVPDRPPTRSAAAPAARPDPPAPAAPAGASEPGLVLRPAGSNQKAQDAIRNLLGLAARDLGRVNYQTLGRDARVQHDTARRFMQQAENALADGNLMFAGKLADKAAQMAAVLVR